MLNPESTRTVVASGFTSATTGSALEVSLKEAREAADKWRSIACKGLDPINEREHDALI